MPGLHCLQHFVPQAPGLEIEFQEAVKNLHPMPGDRAAVHVRTPRMILGSRAYDAYPLTFLSHADRHLLLEGRLYNLSGRELLAALDDLARWIFHAPTDRAAIGKWLKTVDGDFVLFAHDQSTGKTAVVNDIFGRLPLYYRYDQAGLRLARDIRFVYGQKDRLTISPLPLAHFLMLGHALEEKTVWQGLRLLTPGTILLVDPQQRKVTVERLHSFDFSLAAHKNTSPDRNAEHLAEKFVQACRLRADQGVHNLVSLSGGLDSRSVAAGLKAAGVPFSAATFYQRGYTSNAEIRCAAKVAERLNVPWETIGLAGIRCPGALELLKIKAGLSPLYMAFLTGFFHELQNRYGRRLIYFTGDGGDQCLPALRPPVPMTHLRGLAGYIIQDNFLGGRRLGLRLSAALTGLSPKDLKESLIAYLDSFPEKSLEGKWLHLQFYGINVKICFEAEDRNRCFFWSTSPFYSTPFFSHAIQCPQSQKAKFDLYQRFLSKLAPGLEGLEYSGYHGSLGSARFHLNHILKRIKFIRPAWTLYAKHLLKGPDSLPAEARLFQIMKQILIKRPALGAALNFDQVDLIGTHGRKYDRYHIFHVFTTLAMLELGLYGQSTLEDYPHVFLV